MSRDDLAWMDDAACRGTDLSIFFPPPNRDRDSASHVNYVRDTFCRKCPVAAECLEDSLSRDRFAADGIRGGLTANQRRPLAVKRAIA